MKKYLILLILSLVSLALSAHPHMAIESRCDFQFNQNQLQGVWVEYSFDPYFSIDIVNDFDKNKNGLFDDAETASVYKRAFSYCKNYGYFLSIREGEDRWSPDKIDDFSVRYEGEAIIYRFYISLDHFKGKEIFLSTSDSSYFCMVSYNKSHPVGFIGIDESSLEFKIEENLDFPVFYDPYAPAGDKTVHNEWRPGLQTNFPQEIHLVLP